MQRRHSQRTESRVNRFGTCAARKSAEKSRVIRDNSCDFRRNLNMKIQRFQLFAGIYPRNAREFAAKIARQNRRHASSPSRDRFPRQEGGGAHVTPQKWRRPPWQGRPIRLHPGRSAARMTLKSFRISYCGPSDNRFQKEPDVMNTRVKKRRVRNTKHQWRIRHSYRRPDRGKPPPATRSRLCQVL